jgi:hypothetical protein
LCVFNSSYLPRNAAHVRHFEIRGRPSAALKGKEMIQSLSHNAGYLHHFSRKQSNSLDSTFLEALRSYTQIAFVTLKPYSDCQESLTDILRILGDRPSLLRLNVNGCVNEHNAPVLANIDGLRELGLSDPTRAILNLLPEWPNRLSKSLVASHGKITSPSSKIGHLIPFMPCYRTIVIWSHQTP